MRLDEDGNLDSAFGLGGKMTLHFGPDGNFYDEAFGIGATGCDMDDPDAIVEPEVGFAVALLDEAERAALTAHTEWLIPTEAGAVLRGKVAGVPAKVVVGDPTLLLTEEPYADELRRRLGW